MTRRSIDLRPIHEGDPWPVDRPADELLRMAIVNAYKPARGRGGIPLWSEVGALVGYGSSSSMILCEHLGLDPHVRVVRRR